jgi:hypothetical protein
MQYSLPMGKANKLQKSRKKHYTKMDNSLLLNHSSFSQKQFTLTSLIKKAHQVTTLYHACIAPNVDPTYLNNKFTMGFHWQFIHKVPSMMQDIPILQSNSQGC